MEREDVEHLRANLMRLAHDCAEEPGWESDAPMLRFAANILCALRDALDRAEDERHDLAYRVRNQREELARLQTTQEVAQRLCQERNEWRSRASQAEAERDAAYAAGLFSAVSICKRVRNEVAESEDQAVGALECAIAIMDQLNALPVPDRAE